MQVFTAGRIEVRGTAKRLAKISIDAVLLVAAFAGANDLRPGGSPDAGRIAPQAVPLLAVVLLEVMLLYACNVHRSPWRRMRPADLLRLLSALFAAAVALAMFAVVQAWLGWPIQALALEREVIVANFALAFLGLAAARLLLTVVEKSGSTVLTPNNQQPFHLDFSAVQLSASHTRVLLGREPVDFESAQVRQLLRGKNVMVTGAAGSIGAELCRQICDLEPAKLALVERAEPGLFQISDALHHRWPQVQTQCWLADVCDTQRMQSLFSQGSWDIVFHAAAHKHVALLENHPSEAIKNNIAGTKVMADLAERFHVSHFVYVSTDKAVNPRCMMGYSKRIGELYVQAMAQRARGTIFVAVRFGNVLGSSGSVVPIFVQQIARGGPVTVTHPLMKRYFMSVSEAVQLVLQAATLGRGGEVFMLDMGQPVPILHLAKQLICMAGLRPQEDIEIVFTGARPGEKLFEELSTKAESVEQTSCSRIFRSRVPLTPWQPLNQGIEQLLDSADILNGAQILALLRQLVPECTQRTEADLMDTRDKVQRLWSYR